MNWKCNTYSLFHFFKELHVKYLILLLVFVVIQGCDYKRENSSSSGVTWDKEMLLLSEL